MPELTDLSKSNSCHCFFLKLCSSLIVFQSLGLWSDDLFWGYGNLVSSTYLMAMNVWGYDVGSNHYPMLAYTALLPLPHFSLLCTMRYKLLKLDSTSFSPPWMLCLTTAPEVIESSDCGVRPLKRMIPN